VLRLEPQLVLEKDNRTELRGIVLNIEPILFALDNGVTSANTDVVNSHLTFVASAQFEF
jgi:hypothetical protein